MNTLLLMALTNQIFIMEALLDLIKDPEVAKKIKEQIEFTKKGIKEHDKALRNQFF